MKDLSTYLFAILPFIVTYIALWLGLKVWKKNSKKKKVNTSEENDESGPFSRAKGFIGRQKNLSNNQMLVAYALFKQVNFGDCNIEKPPLYDVVSVAKWEAWNKLKGLPSKDAKQAYLEFAISLGWDPKDSSNKGGGGGGGGGGVMGPVQSTMEACDDDDRRKDFEGGEEIFKAASEGDLDTIRSILGEPSSGKDVTSLINLKDDDNEQTALHWACDRGEVEVVKLLLSYPGIDVKAADQTGMSPLHYAVTCEFEEVVQLLMTAGADPHQKDEDGETPMMMAESEEIKHLLSK
jgi:acyl-CoA-binding protein